MDDPVSKADSFGRESAFFRLKVNLGKLILRSRLEVQKMYIYDQLSGLVHYLLMYRFNSLNFIFYEKS